MHQEVPREISPKLLYSEITKNVIGQDKAKKAFANVLFMYYTNLMYNHDVDSKLKINNNFLLMGPSGNGKTLLINEGVKALQKLVDPDMFSILSIDCTALSPEGWKGNNISDMIGNHLEKYGKKKLAIKHTIVYFDEFDKLCMPMVSSGGSDHHKQMQYAMLTLLEGMPYMVDGGRGLPPTEVDTKDWLFVFSGNFPHLRKERDLSKKPGIGFNPAVSEVNEDLYKLLTDSGLTTQIAGRISKVIEIQDLNKAELNEVFVKLLQPKMLEIYNYLSYGLHVPYEKIDEFIALALKRKTGARGLNAAFNEYLEDITFEQVLPIYQKEDVIRKEVLSLADHSAEKRMVNYHLDRLDSVLLKQMADALDDLDLDPNAPEEDYLPESRSVCPKCIEEAFLNGTEKFKVRIMLQEDEPPFFEDEHGHTYSAYIAEYMILCDADWENADE